MMLTMEKKQQLVSEIHQSLSGTAGVVVADYRGLTAAEMTAFRRAARSLDVKIKVLRNTLARRAVEDTDYECLKESFIGPTLLVFSQEEPGAPAKLVHEFAKEHEQLEVRALAAGGQLYGAEELKRIATLPSREGALALLMLTMKAPIQKLAQTMRAVPAKLARTLLAVQKQKQSQEGE